MEVFALKFPQQLHFTDDEFYAFCQENRDIQMERNKHGEIIIMSPTGGITGDKNGEIIAELKLWNRSARLGKAFDSSTGFKLPNGATRSPDTSWVMKSRWEALSLKERKKFPPLCPDFVVELMSESDGLKAAREKMDEWMENGCRLGWLFYPDEEKAYIYRPGQPPEALTGYDKTLSGEEVLPNFTFDLHWLLDS